MHNVLFTDPEVQSSESEENEHTSKEDNVATINLEEKLHAMQSYEVRKRKVAHFDDNSDPINIKRSVSHQLKLAECFASIENGDQEILSYMPSVPTTLSGVKGLAELLRYLIELKTAKEVVGVKHFFM